MVEPARLRAFISHLNTGASPGPSGWSFAHLLPLAADPTCLEYLCSLMHLIANGDSPLTSPSFSCLTAHSRGNRPSEILLQLTAHYLLDSVQGAMPDFPAIPLGIGLTGGSQRAVHSFQAFIDTSHTIGHDPLLVANGFNSRDRGQVLTALYHNAALSPLFSLVDFAYHTASDLLFTDTNQFSIIRSEQGLRQGDVLATLLYSLSVSDPTSLEPLGCR